MTLNERAAVTRARRRLEHIAEQIDKRQYWNALAAANELERALMEAFDEVLKSQEKG